MASLETVSMSEPGPANEEVPKAESQEPSKPESQAPSGENIESPKEEKAEASTKESPESPMDHGAESPKPSAEKPKAPAKKKRKWLRRIAIVFALIPVFALALWIAIHRIDGFGPWLANLGRAILGNDAIAKLEDWAYGVQDKVNLATRSNEKPEAAWEVTPRKERPKDAAALAAQKYPDFDVKDLGPMLQSFSAPGDGTWVPMPDPRFPDEPAPMLKTLLHPDAKRGWAQVAVVAIDLRQVALHLVSGTIEPITTLPEAKAHKRTGIIPADDLGMVIAAFNGGFMATHGHYGMKAEGVLWIEPKDKACTIAVFPNDVVNIRSWEELESKQSEMVFFRQTPMCMEESGKLHPGLTMEENTYWGATLDKETIIRRSAMGISEDGKTLFVGIGEATSAVAIAKAMQFAGSFHVAQLDVNFSYPKFVQIEPKTPGGKTTTPEDLELKPLVKTFQFKPDDYVKRADTRDFFYLTRQPLPKQGAATPEPAASH